MTGRLASLALVAVMILAACTSNAAPAWTFAPIASGPASRSSAPSSAPQSTSAASAARAVLRDAIEHIDAATAYRYRATDDRDHGMAGAKIIPVGGGAFAAVYHSPDLANDLHSHLATSSDLLNWTWQAELAAKASQPTIRPASDGGFVVAWDDDVQARAVFTYYRRWADLLAAAPEKTFVAPRRLPSCAEGTVNLYAASSTFVDAGFHYYENCELDRQARGSTDWTTWTAELRRSLEDPIRALGVAGGVGDRDVLVFNNVEFTIIEGQVVLGDWETFRIHLFDDETKVAEQLDIRSHAGTRAFTNPTLAEVRIGGQRAILVTLFVPQEGAPDEETGELIYYRVIGEAS